MTKGFELVHSLKYESTEFAINNKINILGTSESVDCDFPLETSKLYRFNFIPLTAAGS